MKGTHILAAPRNRRNAEINTASGGLVSAPTVETSRSGGGLTGCLDRVGDEGLVVGWAWDSQKPERRVEISILVDGQPVGNTVADMMREDLKAAGIGDGRYGFSFLLPWDAIASRRTAVITMAGEPGDPPIHSSLTFRRLAVAPIDERLREVEQHVRMLEARMDEMVRRARHEASVMRDVFTTIGAFFTHISELPPESIASTQVSSLDSLLETTSRSLPPLRLTEARAPQITLCIDADGTLEDVYNSLQAIHVAKLDEHSEIYVLDDGHNDRMALLPSLVQNLRYWRLQPGQSLSAARNSTATSTSRPYIAFFSSATRVNRDWLPEVMSTFETRPDCAVLGVPLVRADGTIQHSGLLPDRHGRLKDFGYAQDVSLEKGSPVAAVAAVLDYAMVVRGGAFAQLKGFDLSFANRNAAVIDLCIRCWDEGLSVCYQPAGQLGWDDPTGLASTTRVAMDPDIDSLLFIRWANSRRPSWPEPVGRALLVDAGEMDVAPVDVVKRYAKTLQRLGYQPTICASSAAYIAHTQSLQRVGIFFITASDAEELQQLFVQNDGAFDLICVSSEGAETLDFKLFGQYFPLAKTVLLLNPSSDEVASDQNRLQDRDGAQLLSLTSKVDAVFAMSAVAAENIRRSALPSKPTVFHEEKEGYDLRTGLWLLAGSTLKSTDASRRWWATKILPRLSAAIPNIEVHEVIRDGAEPLAGTNAHRAFDVTPTLLGKMRLALAPMPEPAVDFGDLQTCLEAGLPIIGTPAAFPSKTVPKGVLLVDGNATAFARQVIAHYQDAVALKALAAPISSRSKQEVESVGKAVGETTMRALLDALGLKHAPDTGSA